MSLALEFPDWRMLIERGWNDWVLAFAGTLTGFLSVGFLTIEDRERETWAAELARGSGLLERDFGGHVYQETNTFMFGSDAFRQPFGLTGPEPRDTVSVWRFRPPCPSGKKGLPKRT